MSELRFLTDEHISPAVAREARRHCAGLSVISMREWHDGAFLGSKDEVVVSEASREGLVFVDEKTIAPQDIGGLVFAICLLWRSERRAAWLNRVVFLKAA